jgi:glycerol kinase
MPQTPYLLALDQGTTSSRAMVVDARGQTAGIAAQEFPQLYPRPGWVEHDPEAIWESQLAAVRQVLDSAAISLTQIAAAGITNQRETTLLWRRSDGEPVYNAIVWQDRRTADRCAQLRAEGLTEWIQRKTGLLPDPYFSGTKLEWLLDNVAGARTDAEAGELAFGTVDTWLIWKLTRGQVHRTDRTNASRTLLWNLREERWDPELLELFRIPESLLPEVLPSAADFGTASGVRDPGTELRLRGVAGDQQAALFGQAGWEAGIAKNTYGTGCFLLLNTAQETPVSTQGLLTTAACGRDGGTCFALEGSVFVAGAAVQWLRDGLGLIRSAAETESLAQEVPDSGGVFVVPAFTGLGAPYWDPHARGTIVGITRGTSGAHLVRATLESIALQTWDVVEAMAADAGAPIRTLRVDGGASANDFLMQLQADLLGIPVERAANRETTALGAAYLAGLGCGLWAPADLAQLWKADRVFEPRMSDDQRLSLREGWHRAVERARDWAQ